ncbi:glutamine--fructose-6-phosphate transaminase (isomerizing) [Halegenticoccus tardaugens]|uniref:glutamine--fructose-6-phosphate transaminase (isomerizing) n=1 Tax=Halegenticoccus tardaugens TaxID=2071624 RepID=UPI00100BE669|nr:glutamine--fructose-6-phosphate transaminase (isomerizing) [Halegenticoccus tardaugens]
MCGIIARVGRDDGVDELLNSLSNLEYRGYDSAGVAVTNGDLRPTVIKSEGRIDDLAARIDGQLAGSVGIGHTRWSTHGPPTDANAHPHTGCDGRVAVVHNGIIENHESLRERLVAAGHRFESETDTEVVPHLIEAHLDRGCDPETAFRRTVDELSGSYAIAALVGDDDTVYATRSGSPLVLGVGDEGYYLASDVPAFLEYTDRVVYLEDGQLLTVTPSGYRVTSPDGRTLDPPIETVSWDPEEAGKGAYDHFMLKEIYEQPNALRQAIKGRFDPKTGDVTLDAFDEGAFADVRDIQFVGCGTSYHAAQYGVQLCANRRLPAGAYLASEYATVQPRISEDTLVVGVTQSGETADTLNALREAKHAGARTLALTNVVGSTAARECDDAMLIRAGPEIGVAATKTFSSQVVCLTLLVERLARDRGRKPSPPALFSALDALPDAVQQLLEETTTQEIARRFRDANSYFFIGRNTCYTVALEGALKFKEITYEHAEGFAAGELKHGPLALVTPDTPIIGVLDGPDREKTLHSLAEARARGGPVIAITSDPASVEDVADHVLEVPETHEELAGVLANVQLQLLSYHAAAMLSRPIDKPRNLAKSVTVE